ncbi:MAG: DNA repair protein RadA [Desulfomonilaceae bacterium]
MKTETVFVCRECGKTFPKWMGRCQGCGAWNSVEEREAPRQKTALRGRIDHDDAAVIALSEVECGLNERLRTGIGELDRVLGGGIVKRSVILVAGDPGIGKTTLLMQALDRLSAAGVKTLYISGEESAEQLRLRGERLGVAGDHFLIMIENQLDVLLEALDKARPDVMVLDSVQSLYRQEIQSHPGSMSQVREAASSIIQWIKSSSSACFIVGHITKEGAIAGPKMLEHMVDTVVYFEGERGHPYRLLRAVKNRFGAVSEIGVFEMHESGLEEVVNPSELFLSERPEGVSGSVVTALMEGSRPLLAEIQALVTGPVPGQGRRMCLGVEPQRLALLAAVMEKKLGLFLSDQDIFVNVVGGVRANDPAVDLAIFAALLSSIVDKPVHQGAIVLGEIGLSGEVRRVSRCSERIGEAARLGFPKVFAPPLNPGPTRLPEGIDFTEVRHVKDLEQVLFG